MKRLFKVSTVANGLMFFLVLFLNGCVSTGQDNLSVRSERIAGSERDSLSISDKMLMALLDSESDLLYYEKQQLKSCLKEYNAFSCLNAGRSALKKGDDYASELFARGCVFEDTESCVYRAVMLKSEKIKTAETEKYYKILEDIACSSPKNGSCNSLGWHLFGAGEETEARKYYEFSCVAGDYFACYNLAWLNLKDNPVEGEKYLKISCMGGMPIACVDLGIRYYTGGNKELGEKYAAQSLEKADEYCSNGDGESCDSISRWFKITGEEAKAAEYAKKTESAISNVSDFNAMAKIIKYRNDNPSLFTDTSIEKTGSFKEGEKYKGYYHCSQGITDIEIDIKSVKEENISGTINFKKDEVEGSYFFSSMKTDQENVIKLVSGDWIMQPENYIRVDLMGTKDPDTNQFYGIFLNEECGAFITSEKQTGEMSLSSEIKEMSNNYRKIVFPPKNFDKEKECFRGDKTIEELILQKFGKKGAEVYKLIDGSKNAEIIMNETGVDEDFIINLFEYLEKCEWIKLEQPGQKENSEDSKENNEEKQNDTEENTNEINNEENK